jgi:hypothetical protein
MNHYGPQYDANLRLYPRHRLDTSFQHRDISERNEPSQYWNHVSSFFLLHIFSEHLDFEVGVFVETVWLIVGHNPLNSVACSFDTVSHRILFHKLCTFLVYQMDSSLSALNDIGTALSKISGFLYLFQIQFHNKHNSSENAYDIVRDCPIMFLQKGRVR